MALGIDAPKVCPTTCVMRWTNSVSAYSLLPRMAAMASQCAATLARSSRVCPGVGLVFCASIDAFAVSRNGQLIARGE